MNHRFFTLAEGATPKAQNVYRYFTILLGITALAIPIDAYLAFKAGAWQVWAATAAVTLVMVALYIGLILIRRGHIERAGQVAIYGILVAVAVHPFVIAGVGVGLAIIGIVMTVQIASQTVERTESYTIISFVVAMITILLELFSPPNRLVVPALLVVVPAFTIITGLMLGYLTMRGFRDYSLRTKMIIIIVTITIISVGVIAFLTNRSLTTNLTASIGNNISALSSSKAIEIAKTVEREANLLTALSLNDTIRNSVRSANQKERLSQTDIQQRDSQWRAADAQESNASPLIQSVLHNSAAVQLRQFEQAFPQHAEIFLTDQQGISIAATNRTSDYNQADEEWWQVAYRERLYIGQPEYDDSVKSTVVVMAVAIRETDGRVVGILRTTVDFNAIMQPLVSGLFGETGQAVVYLPNRQELIADVERNDTFSIRAEKSGFDHNILAEENDAYFETTRHQTSVLASQTKVVVPGSVERTALTVSKLNWRLIVFQDLTEALQPVEAQTRNIVLIAFVIFIMAVLAAVGVAQVVSGPLVRLNAVAERVAGGDLSVQATVETGDETGTLAKTFNSMTTQLRDLIGTLEHRVAERTKALAMSAEISRYLSTILNERQLIVEVVEQLKAAFDYYHVQIYLLDEASGDLIMTGGTGDVGASLLGSGHKVPKGKGLVGRAAGTNVPVLVPDTSKDPDWLPNPLLPGTKSETAAPIAIANKVLGVLDVQQNEIGGLRQEDADLLQSIAAQVAIAIQNARSYTEAREKADREARITTIGQKIQSATTVEDALQVAVRELGQALNLNELRVILEAPELAEGSPKSDRVNS